MMAGNPHHGELRRTLELIEMNNGKRTLIDQLDNFQSFPVVATQPLDLLWPLFQEPRGLSLLFSFYLILPDPTIDYLAGDTIGGHWTGKYGILWSVGR